MNEQLYMPKVFPVTSHTDFVGKNSIFIAIEGYVDNGLNYVKLAIEKGARTIVVHQDTLFDPELLLFIRDHQVTIEYVANTRKALADLSAHHAGYPAKKLTIFGITGTKGKTTTSFLLEHILAVAGYKTALISSAQNKICGVRFPAPLTTPQPDYLQQFLKLCLENNVEYVVMEVAAQALTLYRVEGIIFAGVIFTNFSHEHLEFYKTLEDYFYAKTLLFNMTAKSAPLIINADNDHGKLLLARYPKAVSYGFDCANSSYYAQHSSNPVYGIDLTVMHKECVENITCTRLFGDYNAYNLLAATSMALALSIKTDVIRYALQTFVGVPGRLQEHALTNGARCFIDYAHNPESFEAVLSTLRLLTDQLIVVFGAGGGRDKFKRPIMGSVAANIADIVIITSDNPRLEDPEAIAQEIIQGISDGVRHKVVQELDRKKAIELAYMFSDQESIIALLGKGPDEYQIIGKIKYHFSERMIIESL